MAVHHFTSQLRPLFSQLIDNVEELQIGSVSNLAQSHLGTCKYEDDFFGGGAVIIVTKVESESYYRPRHFRAIKLNAELMNRLRMSLSSNPPMMC
jgi:hypothetical protein